MLNVLRPARVLVVAASAREALFGCGATLKAHAAAGAKVRTVIPRAGARLDQTIMRFRPELLYTHDAAAAPVREALKRLPAGTVKEVRRFETAPRRGLAPRLNLFIAMKPQALPKKSSLAASLARLRGAQCGAAAAEAFSVDVRIEP